MREDSKTIIFALGICLVCSVLLSGLAAGLKKIQTANREFDVKRNIVKAFGVDIGVLSKNEIEEKYSTHISKNTIDLDNEIIFGDGKPYSQITFFLGKMMLMRNLLNMHFQLLEKVYGAFYMATLR